MAVFNRSERRRYTRVEFATAIQIVLEVDGKKINFNTSSRNLSLKGVLITTQMQSYSGTNCRVKVYLTGGIDKIELMMKGRVVGSYDNGMGIIFDSMDVDTYSHLKNIVYYNGTDADC